MKKSIRVFLLLILAVMLNAGMACPGKPQLLSSEANNLTSQPLNSNALLPLSTFESSNDFESFELELVFPGSSNTFDPFTFGRPGSPYGPNRLFEPGAGVGRCGPMSLPMSSQFSDPPPGNTQASLIVVGSGVECLAEINHDVPGVAITFPLLTAIFTNPPWTLVSVSTTQATITNGTATLRFTFNISATVTTITKVEYL